MKLKYININGFGVLVDENAEIKEGDFYYWKITNTIQKAKKDSLDRLPKKLDGSFKIIFAEKELNLDVPTLPNWREWEIEQLIYQSIKDNADGKGLFPSSFYKGFKLGYNQNKAKYTEEDLRKAIEFAYNNGYRDRDLDIGHGSNLPYSFEYIQLLQKVPKYIVMESKDLNDYQEGIIKEIIYQSN